jgi:membrane protease YdiL (CAAX protease family)
MAWLGWPGWEGLPTAIATSLLLTATIYAGPLLVLFLFSHISARKHINAVGQVVAKPEHEIQSTLGVLLDYIVDRSSIMSHPWAFIRNVISAPITEEFVFRGCFIPLLLSNGVPLTRAIFLSPLVFGVAHVHHIYARLRAGCRYAA